MIGARLTTLLEERRRRADGSNRRGRAVAAPWPGSIPTAHPASVSAWRLGSDQSWALAAAVRDADSIAVADDLTGEVIRPSHPAESSGRVIQIDPRRAAWRRASIGLSINTGLFGAIDGR